MRVQIRAHDVSLSLDSEARSSILNEFDMKVSRVIDSAEGEVLIELAQTGSTAISTGENHGTLPREVGDRGRTLRVREGEVRCDDRMTIE